MKTLYLHPSLDLRTPAYGIIPVGAFAICGLLRQQGHTVRMVNMGLELLLDAQFCLLPVLEGFRPDLILLELHWYVHARGAVELAREIRRWSKTVPVVSGGISASIFAYEILAGYPEIDYLIVGDGELAVTMLAQQLERPAPDLESVPNLWWRADGKPVRSRTRHSETTLDHLPWTDYDLLDNWDLYTLASKVPDLQFVPARPQDFWLCNARGCVFQCDFCGGGKQAQQTIYGRQGIVTRSVTCLAGDIQALYPQSGIRQICLSYDLALMKKDYYLPLLETWPQRKWELGLYNECWQLPSRTFVEAFCRSVIPSLSALVFSPISGDESVRRQNGKFFSNAHLLELLRYLADHQIPVQLFFNFNAQGHDLPAFQATIELCRLIAAFYPPGLLRLVCQDVAPEPLSPRGERGRTLRFADFVSGRTAALESPDELKCLKELLWQQFESEYAAVAEPVWAGYSQSFLDWPAPV